MGMNMTYFSKMIMESTKIIGQKYIKWGTKFLFLFFSSWFSSKKAEESAMEFGSELIGTVNKNTKGLCK